jgi:hypothetical protein
LVQVFINLEKKFVHVDASRTQKAAYSGRCFGALARCHAPLELSEVDTPVVVFVELKCHPPPLHRAHACGLACDRRGFVRGVGHSEQQRQRRTALSGEGRRARGREGRKVGVGGGGEEERKSGKGLSARGIEEDSRLHKTMKHTQSVSTHGLLVPCTGWGILATQAFRQHTFTRKEEGE